MLKFSTRTPFLISEKPVKVGIIINSLSAVILHQNIAAVCRDLYDIISYRSPCTVHFSVFHELYNDISDF